MPHSRILASRLLPRFQPLRSGFPFPRMHHPPIPGDPHARKTLTFFGIAVRWVQFCLIVHTVTKYIVSVSATDGISMVPTIPHSFRKKPPRVLVSKLHRRGRNLKVGDIVVYAHPMIDQVQGAKRIVGMPGDFVSVLGPGKSGEEIERSDIVKSGVKEEMVQVPEGHCWLAGDNLEWSRDSRMFGPVPLALVKGKVCAVLFPFEDMKWFRNGLEDATADDREVVIQS